MPAVCVTLVWSVKGLAVFEGRVIVWLYALLRIG